MSDRGKDIILQPKSPELPPEELAALLDLHNEMTNGDSGNSELIQYFQDKINAADIAGNTKAKHALTEIRNTIQGTGNSLDPVSDYFDQLIDVTKEEIPKRKLDELGRMAKNTASTNQNNRRRAESKR